MALLTRAFSALGTRCEIVLDHDGPAEAALDAAEAEVHRFERKFSRYRDDSVVAQINADAGLGPTPIDEETHGLLRYAEACYRQSDGLFDITSGVLRKVWHRERRELPTDRDLEPCLARIGWPRVRFDEHSVFLPISGMQIDLGGIGKEYIADAVTARLRSAGFAHGVVNLGGDVTILGPHADGSPWWVGITHPFEAGKSIASIALTEGALTTSGSYERYIEIAGKRYSHVLDPRTGWPVEGLVSVSVLAPRALVAGTISLIALLKGASSAITWLEGSGARYLAVDRECQIRGSLASRDAT